MIFENNPKTLLILEGILENFLLNVVNIMKMLIKIVDLPGQLNMALSNVSSNGFKDRISGHEIDWLSENPQIPSGADTNLDVPVFRLFFGR